MAQTDGSRKTGEGLDLSPAGRRAARIREATTLAKRSAAGGGGSAYLQSEAETIHYELLGEICALTDEEASLIEPAFTELEEQLLLLSRRAGHRPKGN